MLVTVIKCVATGFLIISHHISVQHQPIRLLEELPLTSMVMEHLPRSSSVLVYAKKVISIVELSLLSDHFMN